MILKENRPLWCFEIMKADGCLNHKLRSRMAIGEKAIKRTMTREEAVGLIKEFIAEELPGIDWYQKISGHLKAIVFYGSRAKGTNRMDSDVDLLFFMPLAAEEKYTAGEYVYDFRDHKLNIVIRSIERLRKMAEGPKDKFEQEVFRACEVIWDRDGEVASLINELLG